MDPFDTFWQFYPRKVGKKAALRAWKKMTAEERVNAAEMAEAFGEAMEHVHPANRQFLPHPSTWLNEGRWEDDPVEWQLTGRELERPRR
jgi:hypothetical protein